MGKKGSGMFRGGDLKLNREIRKEREADTRQAQKGFIGQLHRAQERKSASSYDTPSNIYKGQDVTERRQEIPTPEKKLDPSTLEEDSKEKGFINELNWNYTNPRK